jgi:two-component system OmpR family sensor kinase
VSRLFLKYLLVFWMAVIAVELAMDGTSSFLRYIQKVPTLASETAQLRTRVDSLRMLLEQDKLEQAAQSLQAWRQQSDGPEIFVLDGAGRELLARPLSDNDKHFALAPDMQDAPFSQQVTGRAGQRYAVFIHEQEAGRIMYRTRIQLPWKFELIAALLVGLCFSALLAWYWAAPLRSLQWALSSIAQGRLNTRVSPRMGRRRDELHNLGEEFDRMAQRTELLVNAQRRLLHDVSHELRSPLARLQTAVELAVRQHGGTIGPELNRISREAQRVNALVGELLLLARLENGIDVLQRGRVDVMELVVAIADDAQFEAKAHARDVTLACEGAFVAEVCAELVYRAYENVIRNAVKYTKPGTSVDIHAVAAGDRLVVSVSDRGPGLSDDLLHTIFDPFRRFESDPGIAGFGLGLAIARQAMEAHGGSIAVTRNLHGGLTFTLELRRSALVPMAGST